MVIGGCNAGGLAGPDVQGADDAVVVNGGDGGGTETGAGHNINSGNE